MSTPFGVACLIALIGSGIPEVRRDSRPRFFNFINFKYTTMKFFLPLLFLTCISLNAQDIVRKLKFNINTGIVFSDCQFPVAFEENQPVSENLTSFTAGAGIEYYLNKTITLNLNGRYLKTGAEKTGEIFKTIEVSQIQIPVTVKAYVSNFIYVEGGGYISSVIDFKYRTYSGETNIDYIENEKTDYGALFGLGFSHERFFIHANYSFGFKNLIKINQNKFDPEFDPIVDGGITANFKNRYFIFGAGLKF